jgi:hypothetical protein
MVMPCEQPQADGRNAAIKAAMKAAVEAAIDTAQPRVLPLVAGNRKRRGRA